MIEEERSLSKVSRREKEEKQRGDEDEKEEIRYKAAILFLSRTPLIFVTTRKEQKYRTRLRGFHSSFSPYVYLINRDREARGSGSKREKWQARDEMKRERERVGSLEGKRMGEERRTSGAHMVHSCSRGQVFVHEPSVLQIRPSFSMSLYLYTG